MRIGRRSFSVILGVVCLVVFPGPTASIAWSQIRQEMPGEGLSHITPIYEGWYKNKDGTVTLSFGYLNRTNTTIEIPVGADNTLSPPPENRGQPTKFLPGRRSGVIKLVVPKDFQGNITWTVAYEGTRQTTSQRGGLNPGYMMIDPPIALDAGANQTVALASGAELSGTARAENLPEGMTLKVLWTKVAGPGEVTFSAPASVRSHATFSAPGQYVLRLAAGVDTSTDFETRAELRVTVTP